MLVSDGAKLGAVAIELEDGLVSFALPKGTAEGQDIIPNSVALPFVLAPGASRSRQTNAATSCSH